MYEVKLVKLKIAGVIRNSEINYIEHCVQKYQLYDGRLNRQNIRQTNFGLTFDLEKKISSLRKIVPGQIRSMILTVSSVFFISKLIEI